MMFDFLKKYLLFITPVFFIFFSPSVKAYPSLVRHGYVGCLVCHTSPNGGDLLTDYGKSLSKELISAKSFTKGEMEESDEAQKENLAWLRVEFNHRSLQTFIENSAVSKGRFLMMQMDLDALIKPHPNWDIYTSVGRYEPNSQDVTLKDFIYYPRYWLGFRQTLDESDTTYLIRFGRFQNAYGVNFAEHFLVSKKYLDLSPGQERLQLEFYWGRRDFELTLSQIRGGFLFAQSIEEQGTLLRLAKLLSEPIGKVGINFYQSKNPVTGLSKKMMGLFAILGFRENWSLEFQADRPESANETKGFAESAKLGYEVVRGVQIFATQEYFNSDVRKTDPHVDAFGLGCHYFPLPYLDFEGQFRKLKDSSVLDEHQNIFWMVAHVFI